VLSCVCACVWGVMSVVLCMCVCVGRNACCLVSSHSTNKRRSLSTAQSYTTSFHDSYHIVAIKPSTAAFTNNKWLVWKYQCRLAGNANGHNFSHSVV